MDIGCYLGLGAHFQTTGRRFVFIDGDKCNRVYKEIRGLLEHLDTHRHSSSFIKTISNFINMYITFIINLDILNYVIQNKTLVVSVCSFLVIIIVSVLSNAGNLCAQTTPFDERKTTTIMQSNSLVESIKDKRGNVVSNVVFVVNSTIENKNQG